VTHGSQHAATSPDLYWTLPEPLEVDVTADEAPRPAVAAADPRPTPPTRPDPDDCCHSGCDPCVFDLYEEEVTRYRAALAAWEARHARPEHGQREDKPRRKR
jgi:hypothetical protein